MSGYRGRPRLVGPVTALWYPPTGPNYPPQARFPPRSQLDSRLAQPGTLIRAQNSRSLQPGKRQYVAPTHGSHERAGAGLSFGEGAGGTLTRHFDSTGRRMASPSPASRAKLLSGVMSIPNPLCDSAAVRPWSVHCRSGPTTGPRRGRPGPQRVYYGRATPRSPIRRAGPAFRASATPAARSFHLPGSFDSWTSCAQLAGSLPTARPAQ